MYSKDLNIMSHVDNLKIHHKHNLRIQMKIVWTYYNMGPKLTQSMKNHIGKNKHVKHLFAKVNATDVSYSEYTECVSLWSP